MTEVTFYVPSISCMHCVHTIQTEIGALAGVKSVAARADTKEVAVAFDTPLTQAQIEAALAEINYPAVESN
jgi:copper ion binding protein